MTTITIALTSLAAGSALAVAGIYLLAGAGWALLAAAVPMCLLGAILVRGVVRG